MRSSLLRAALALVLAGTAITGAGRLSTVHADGAHPSTVGPCSLSPGQLCIDIEEPPLVPANTIDITGVVQDRPGKVDVYLSDSAGTVFSSFLVYTAAMVRDDRAGFSRFRLSNFPAAFQRPYIGYVTVWAVNHDVLHGPDWPISNQIQFWAAPPAVTAEVPSASPALNPAVAMVSSALPAARSLSPAILPAVVRTYCRRVASFFSAVEDTPDGWVVVGSSAIAGDLLQVNLIAVLPFSGQLTVSRQEVTAGTNGRFRVQFNQDAFVDHDSSITYDWHTVSFEVHVTDRATGNFFSSNPLRYDEVCS